MRIDLNSDLGEVQANFDKGLDEKVIQQVTSINVACGYHAGSPELMRATVGLAKKYNTAVGAHPGYRDPDNFGRTRVQQPLEQTSEDVRVQVSLLLSILAEYDMPLQHVKPHGALYNMGVEDYAIAEAIIKGIRAAGVSAETKLLAPPGSQLIRAAQAAGMPVALEFFADRAYNEDGSLVNRKLENSVISDVDLVMDRVMTMINERKVVTYTGKDMEMKADSICVHGDNEEAVQLTASMHEALEKDGVEILAFGK